MTDKQTQRLLTLQELWATRQATKPQILRCMELEAKSRADDNLALQRQMDRPSEMERIERRDGGA